MAFKALALLQCTFIFFLWTKPAAGSLIAVGNLQSCFDSGTTEGLECSQKIVVTLALENNRLHRTESLRFAVACVNSTSGTCPCDCTYGVDPGCGCRDLRRTISVSVTKTPVYALYPLSQPRTFNGRPYEAYIPTGPGGTVGGACEDDPFLSNPTCGWAQAPDANGNMQDIPDSQGFCCRCPTWGSTSPIYRGYRSCDWSPSWAFSSVPGSAHCLRYDDYWWYRGYVIGPYQLDFDIQVHINTTTAGGVGGNGTDADSTLETLSVNPSRTFLRNDARTVSVRLVGDLDSYRQIQPLAGHWVMIPLQPGLSPNEVFTSNLDMWVVLPPEMVTTSGECNKVGVDYTAFRTQPGACAQPVGACLRNQIFDLEEADNARIAQGLDPLYNITRYGGGYDNERQMAAIGDGGGLALRLPLKGLRTSLVTLQVAADDLQMVTNRAPGKILSAEVCTFDRVLCGGFTAISGAGFLTVTVQNTGTLDAEYRTGVLGCSGGVLPVGEEFATIGAGDSKDFEFELQAETDQAGNRTCTVVVTDAAGDIADSTTVNFYTNATQYEDPPDQSDPNGPPTDPGNPPKFLKCADYCPNLFNVKCALFRGCWKRLAAAIAVAAAIAAGVTLALFALKQGWVTGFLKLMFKLVCSGRKKKKISWSRAEGGADGTPPPGPPPGGPVWAGDPMGYSRGPHPWPQEHYYRPKAGYSMADTAAAAMAAKQWRHRQQQQQALDLAARPPDPMEDASIGAYRDGPDRYYDPPPPPPPPPRPPPSSPPYQHQTLRFPSPHGSAHSSPDPMMFCNPLAAEQDEASPVAARPRPSPPSPRSPSNAYST